MLLASDGSVVTPNGQVLVFSVRRFISDVVLGDVCFVCGASPSPNPFNREHVIPDWMLRLNGLHSQNVTLPNGAPAMYGRYTIPCCVTCNGDLAKNLEDPISNAFAEGYEGVRNFCEGEGGPLMFRWLALIFLKAHLKDLEMHWNLDRRKGNTKIAEVYNWEELHHVHCVARSLFTGARLEPSVYGSLLILRACLTEGIPFDFGDLFKGRSLLLRSGDVAVIAVLNDSGLVRAALNEDLGAISSPLTVLQLRELMVRAACTNIRLHPRPVYQSLLDLAGGDYAITADVPERFSIQADPGGALYGSLLDFTVRPILEAANATPEMTAGIRTGRYSFLFDTRKSFLPSCPETGASS